MSSLDSHPTSPLLTAHERAGARLTNFAGWVMPLRFTSDVAEHEAVRTSAGLFDLSHMGQIEVTGPEAADVLDRSFVSRCSTLVIGRARYTMMVADDGGILDDVIVYRTNANEFLVIANAANRVRVADEITRRGRNMTASVVDRTLSRALIAIQGPCSAEAIAPLLDFDPARLGYYHCTIAHLQLAPNPGGGEPTAVPAFVARTGYTGEDGFEITVPAHVAEPLWSALLDTGKATACGLAARDSLRLEAGMALYGHELSDRSTPYDVGLGRLVDIERDFVGRDVLHRRAALGCEVGTHLIGLVGQGRRPARAEDHVLLDGDRIGTITSGILSPTLGYPIALALVDCHLSAGTVVDVDVRGRLHPMTVTTPPFYRRAPKESHDNSD